MILDARRSLPVSSIQITIALEGRDEEWEVRGYEDTKRSEFRRDDLQSHYPLEVSPIVGKKLEIVMNTCGGDEQIKVLDNLSILPEASIFFPKYSADLLIYSRDGHQGEKIMEAIPRLDRISGMINPRVKLCQGNNTQSQALILELS